MLLFQPARLVNQLEVAFGVLQEPLKRLGFLLQVLAVPLDEQVEINLVSVEFGAVYAGELRSLSGEHPAAAAHAGAVNHHRVQAYDRLDLVRTRRLGDRLHHPRRANGQNQIDLPARLDQGLELVGHEPLASVACRRRW